MSVQVLNGHGRPSQVPASPGRRVGLPGRVKRAVKELLLSHYERCLDGGGAKILFLISHLRSGSTLLLHVLNTNPRIAGYGERHEFYRDRRDLARLTLDVCLSLRQIRSSGMYFMDKVNFDYVAHRELLREDCVRTIFLLREPEQTLPSLLWYRHGATGHTPGEPPFETWNEELTVQYYLQQLRVIEEYAGAVGDPKRAFVMTYHELMNDTPTTLGALQRFLNLGHPLSSEYDRIWSTGHRIHGDTSDAIKSGRILTEKKPLPLIALRFSTDAMAEAQVAFDHSLSVLSALSSSRGTYAEAHCCATRRPPAK